MAAAFPLVSVPPLERLSQLSLINLNQMSSGYNGNNYTVFGKGGEVIFTLNEVVPDTNFRGRPQRAFRFHGMDTTGRTLFSFRRPEDEVYVSNKVELFMKEILVSNIHLAPTFITPIFNINDALDNPVLRLKGQTFDVNYFQLQTNKKKAIGAIQRKTKGWTKEIFSLRDDYLINFPVDLAVTFKIAVIVSCVFIDFKFHEGK